MGFRIGARGIEGEFERLVGGNLAAVGWGGGGGGGEWGVLFKVGWWKGVGQ